MSKNVLEMLFSQYMEGKKDRKKQLLVYMTSLYKWIARQMMGRPKKETLTRGTKDIKLWGAIVAHVLKRYFTEVRL